MKLVIDKENCYDRKIEIIKPLLLHFIKSRIYNHQDCQDILQNTLFILIKKRDTYLPNKSFYSWSFTICRFQIKRYLSESSRSREFCSSDHLDNTTCSIFDPFLVLDNKESLSKKQELTKTIEDKHLSCRETEFFQLFKEGKSRSEIMSAMNIKQVNYYQYRTRVAQRFAKHFSAYEQEV